ncbi:30S ribosomal protein S20 [Haliangium sp.]|uniref:30S ribosomal protein S20 n=1 Tax=Haliangium sp. TaxID=2663208 RepID=UPI003D120284
MPNHKSAEKRDRQRDKRRLRNRLVVGRMRTAVKKARTALEQNAPERDKLLKSAVSLIDKAVTKGALKRNTASRYISRLVKRAGQPNA